MRREPDPAFATLTELRAWVRQRRRFVDPAPGADQRAAEDIRRVAAAHSHLLERVREDAARAIAGIIHGGQSSAVWSDEWRAYWLARVDAALGIPTTGGVS